MGETKQRPGVMMYFHLLKPLRCLPKEQFADLVWALMDYAEFGAEPVFSEPMLEISWGFLRHAADVDLERYEARRQRAIKGANKRWHEEAMLNDAYDAKNRNKTEAETTSDINTKADADAHTQASASAKTQTKEEAPQSFEIPFVAGEDFQAWRERQIEAITRYNQSLREKAKKQNAS